MAEEKRSIKEMSRRDIKAGLININALQTGALMRIADAVELAVKDRMSLEAEATCQRMKANDLMKLLRTEKRRVAAYKGQAANLKFQLRMLRRLKAARTEDNHDD